MLQPMVPSIILLCILYMYIDYRFFKIKLVDIFKLTNSDSLLGVENNQERIGGNNSLCIFSLN